MPSDIKQMTGDFIFSTPVMDDDDQIEPLAHAQRQSDVLSRRVFVFDP